MRAASTEYVHAGGGHGAPYPGQFVDHDSYTRDLEAALWQVRRELGEAGRLQRELFATPLPESESLSIEVLYEPAEALSGDLYHVARVDASRVVVTLADATGHGPAAAVLSTYVRQTLTAGTGSGDVLEPADVLQRLNAAILDAGLSECQSVASLCAVIDEETGLVRLARAGASLPILVRAGGSAAALPSEGPVAGAIEGARFETISFTLEPGDRLYLHTDGVDALLLDPILMALEFSLTETAWFRSLSQSSPAASLRALRARLAKARTSHEPLDDLTVVAIERRTSPAGRGAPG